ncbi:GTP-binding protein Rho1 [Borealophlyctis nickersoniae]|nr:GTP-binding protein Rho1 [Borealophlyctis nickersoniae]
MGRGTKGAARGVRLQRVLLTMKLFKWKWSTSSTSTEQPGLRRKIVVVGDGATGKTVLLRSFVFQQPRLQYIPTVFETYAADLPLNGKVWELALWDTAGQEDYDRLRPLSYPDSHAIFICFSLDSLDSLEDVEEKWIGEVRHFCMGLPVYLVGLKADLKNRQNTRGWENVSSAQGMEVARKIGAAGYVECSAKTGHGVNQLFALAMGAKAPVPFKGMPPAILYDDEADNPLCWEEEPVPIAFPPTLPSTALLPAQLLELATSPPAQTTKSRKIRFPWKNVKLPAPSDVRDPSPNPPPSHTSASDATLKENSAPPPFAKDEQGLQSAFEGILRAELGPINFAAVGSSPHTTTPSPSSSSSPTPTNPQHPPSYTPTWTCKAGHTQHHFFISYRVHPDGALSQILCLFLQAKGYNVYLDRDCLIPGHDYKDQFLMGLNHSRMILLLITEAALEGFKTAHTTKGGDNVLLEWEHAIKLMDRVGTDTTTRVLPIFVGHRDAQTGKQVTFGAWDTDVFPDAPHAHPFSTAKYTVRETVRRVFGVQGIVDILPSQMGSIVAQLEGYKF